MTTSTLTHQLTAAAGSGVAAGGLVVALGAGFAGSAGALGALVGGGLTLAVFTFGAGSVALVAKIQPRAALGVALLTYLTQVVLLVACFAGLQRSGLLDGTLDRAWLAVAVIAVTLTWSALQILAWQRGQTPLQSPLQNPGQNPGQDPASAPAETVTTGGER